MKEIYKEKTILDNQMSVFITSVSKIDTIQSFLKQNMSVAIFSLGISEDELMIKLLSSYTKIPIKNIKIANMNDEQWSKFYEGIDFFSKSKLFINDEKLLSIDILNKKIKELKRKNYSQKFVFVMLSNK